MDNEEILEALLRLQKQVGGAAIEASVLEQQVGSTDDSAMRAVTSGLFRAERNLQIAIVEIREHMEAISQQLAEQVGATVAAIINNARQHAPLPPTLGVAVSDSAGIKDRPHG